MGLFKGGALRLFQTFLYVLAFCCAGIILGIYSYFLAVLADRHEGISKREKAVEGISGVAVVYTIFAVILTCCLGGVSFFAFMGIVLDVLFIGGMIAIAVMTRQGASSCSGYVETPLGSGQSGSSTGGFHNGANQEATYSVNLRNACRLNTAVFAISIIGAVVFLITAVMQLALIRHHKKEKRYGPGPENNYTSGYGSKFWQRKKSNKHAKEVELGTAGGLSAGAVDTRPSHDTNFTGSTAAAPGTTTYDKVDGYNATPQGIHGGYHTQPQGTAVNPYGYENNTTNHYTTGTATNY